MEIERRRRSQIFLIRLTYSQLPEQTRVVIHHIAHNSSRSVVYFFLVAPVETSQFIFAGTNFKKELLAENGTNRRGSLVAEGIVDKLLKTFASHL